MATRRRLLAAFVIGLVTADAGIASADDYPSRPVTIIAPFGAGGSIDTVARVLADRMKNSLGQPVVVEDVVGAGGSIGTGRVAHAAPDGYTIILGNVSTHVTNGATYALKYDVVDDFAPITLLTTEPMLATARNTMAATDVTELVAWLKANGDKASAAVGGTGDITQIADIMFQQETKTRFQMVPYGGSVLAMNDVIAGRIDLLFIQASSVLPQISAGRIKAYAVMDKKRLTAAPDIPTIDEAGLPGFYVNYWFGMWAPKGTPAPVIAKLNTAIVDALADDTVKARLNELGREIVPRAEQTPEALGALQRAEIKRWWPIIKAAGIKVE
jgi:tripartite-type tricarboxylate transporter receptor subunit TctC